MGSGKSIYNYNILSQKKLKDTKENFNNLKEDFKLFDNKIINQIGTESCVRRLENISREKLIKRLETTSNNPENLSLRYNKCIQEYYQ